jgi:hypothetical protein
LVSKFALAPDINNLANFETTTLAATLASGAETAKN